jgi:hypothetical protein
MSLWTLASPLSQHPAPLLDQSKDVVKRPYSPEALQSPEQLNQALGRKGCRLFPQKGLLIGRVVCNAKSLFLLLNPTCALNTFSFLLRALLLRISLTSQFYASGHAKCCSKVSV